MITDADILSGKFCPYCGCPAEHVPAKVIYGSSAKFGGMFYHCAPCRAWVGCHKPRPREALGRLADHELREWKIAAHNVFDGLWRARKSLKPAHARRRAYKWLAVELGIDAKYCHIGFFGVEECKRVVDICTKYYKK